MLRTTCLAWWLLMLCSAAAYADTDRCSMPPKQAVVCDSKIVSKEKLANYALDACGVSRNFEDALVASGKLPSKGTLTTAERLLIADPCATPNTCKQENANALTGARVLINAMLNLNAPAYVATGANTAEQYFTDDHAELQCGTDTRGKAIEALGSSPPSKGWTPSKRLRLRGAPDNLYFSNDLPQFSSTDKATLGSSYSSGNVTRTDKIVAFVGYAIRDPLDSPPYGAIPYIGVNRNITRPTGQSVSVSVNTVDLGVENSLIFRTELADPTQKSDPLTHWITLRPDFLINHKDDGHLVSLSAVYTPIHNTYPICVNVYHRLFESQLSMEPILDIRSDFGHYAQAGTGSGTDYRNYWRVGPRAGFSLGSDYSYLPIDLTVTDVFLEGFSGTLPHINYFKSILSYRIAGKNVSLDMSFSQGRREDTAQPEHQWSVGLSAAY